MSGLLGATSSAADKRAAFRAGLNSGRLQRFPGAFSPLVAKLVAEIGFEGVYVSGAVLSADLGLPDIGLTTLTEVTARGAQIASVTDLPTLIDADTGFGEPMNAARTITETRARLHRLPQSRGLALLQGSRDKARTTTPCAACTKLTVSY